MSEKSTTVYSCDWPECEKTCTEEQNTGPAPGWITSYWYEKSTLASMHSYTTHTTVHFCSVEHAFFHFRMLVLKKIPMTGPEADDQRVALDSVQQEPLMPSMQRRAEEAVRDREKLVVDVQPLPVGDDGVVFGDGLEGM